MTRMQLRGCAIDSQVLIVISLPQCAPGFGLAKRYSFDIIRAIEFATPEDFISLKTISPKNGQKKTRQKAGSKP
jgi:hypothetical protein